MEELRGKRVKLVFGNGVSMVEGVVHNVSGQALTMTSEREAYSGAIVRSSLLVPLSSIVYAVVLRDAEEG